MLEVGYLRLGHYLWVEVSGGPPHPPRPLETKLGLDTGASGTGGGQKEQDSWAFSGGSTSSSFFGFL